LKGNGLQPSQDGQVVAVIELIFLHWGEILSRIAGLRNSLRCAALRSNDPHLWNSCPTLRDFRRVGFHKILVKPLLPAISPKLLIRFRI
jgi:hypothetical protein